MAIDPSGLLMIEPTRDAHEPIEDEYTQLARLAWAEAVASKNRFYCGVHRCICGERNDNRMWTVRGWVTNSLLVHYVREHRDEVPETDIAKLMEFEPEIDSLDPGPASPGPRARRLRRGADRAAAP